MKCSIVKELLPSYRDGLTSEETNRDIRDHLETCGECRACMETMSQKAIQSVKEENALELLVKLQARIRRNRIIAAVSVSVILMGLVIFARIYWIPLPFDANRMEVETFQGVFVTQEEPYGKDEYTRLYDLDGLDLETTRKVLNGECEIVESVLTATHGINDVMQSSRSRLIERDGQEIKVLYYCYSKTLWGSIFHGDFAPYSESLTAIGLAQTAVDLDEPDERKPRMTEVYYLPIRNLPEKLDRLSDEEFDAMREHGSLIWSGMTV